MSFARRKVIKGSRHTIYVTQDGRQIEVPRHSEIRRDTARNIARQAGIEWSEFSREIT